MVTLSVYKEKNIKQNFLIFKWKDCNHRQSPFPLPATATASHRTAAAGRIQRLIIAVQIFSAGRQPFFQSPATRSRYGEPDDLAKPLFSTTGKRKEGLAADSGSGLPWAYGVFDRTRVAYFLVSLLGEGETRQKY